MLVALRDPESFLIDLALRWMPRNEVYVSGSVFDSQGESNREIRPPLLFSLKLGLRCSCTWYQILRGLVVTLGLSFFSHRKLGSADQWQLADNAKLDASSAKGWSCLFFTQIVRSLINPKSHYSTLLSHSS